MKSLGSYTLGDQYVSPERRLSAMLTQQGSRGGPSNSWQETMGRIAQQLAGAYIGRQDSNKQNQAFDAQTGLEPDSTSMKQTYTPEQVQGFASKLHGGVSDSFEPSQSDMNETRLGSFIAPTLNETAGNVRPQVNPIQEESFGPQQAQAPQPRINGSGWDRSGEMPDFSGVHQLNSRAGIPQADPRQEAVNLMQRNQTEQLNKKMNPRDYSMQQLRGLENNPYAKRILAQMMMQNADRDYAAEQLKGARGFTTSERIAGQNFSKGETDRKLKSAEDVAGGKQSFGNEDKLRTAFIKGSGDFIKVRDAYGRIQASAKDPSPAGDLALIFNYMKVLDPGSTVREGEFATAANSASIPDRLIAQYNKVVNGERLAPAQRQDFVSRAGDLYGQQETFYKGHEERYRELATSYGLNPDNVVYGLNKGLQGATPEITPDEQAELEELRKWKAGQGKL